MFYFDDEFVNYSKHYQQYQECFLISLNHVQEYKNHS